MKLKSYNEFILESILLTSNYLLDLIKSIDDPIAQKFTQLVNQDIKTKYNIINLTDTNDKLSFIPDSQTNTKLKSGSKPEDLFDEKSNQTTIGRIVRSILTDNKIEYTDHEIEKFVNKFKSTYDSNKIKTSKVEPIRVVRGEDIRFWYLGKNYCEETIEGKGSLGKSCMRYKSCQEYLDIYVNNPEECGLVIYVNDANELVSRALIWKLDSGYYLDRVYYTNDSDTDLIRKWVSENFKISKSGSPKVQLTGKSNPDGSYDAYPYMDTLMYYDMSNKTLNSSDDDVDKKYTLELQDTGGYGTSIDLVYCEYNDESYPSDQVVWSEHLDSYIHRDNAIYSKHHGSHISINDSVYSKKYGDYYDENYAILVYLDQDEKEIDYFIEGDEDIFQDPVSGKNFLSELSDVDDNGNISLKKNIWTVYQVEPESIEDYRKIYNILDDKEKYLAVEVDQNLFDIKLNKATPERMLNKIFISEYYKYLLYEKISEMIEDKDYSYRNIKNDQLAATDEILKRDSIFLARNMIRKFSIDQFMSLWLVAFDENFKNLLESVYIRWKRGSSRISKLCQDLEKSNPYFQSSLESITKELLEDPRKWHLGFWQDSSEINQDIRNEILNDITGSFKSESYDSDEVTTFILEFTKGVFDLIKYECRWDSYQGIRWMETFDTFLINQALFRDIVKQ